MDEHPDYKVGVSGHSLGGALAVIFAMEAAAYLKTDFPVTCVALGNPRAGNLEFRHVVQVGGQRCGTCLLRRARTCGASS